MQDLVLYTRVSDKDKQGDNFSLDTQLEPMRAWAKAEGWNVVAELAETESASQYGEGLDRTKLGIARQLAREGKVQGLMFYDMDRFTRDIGDGVILRRELYRLNVKLFCFCPYPHEITSDQEILHILADWRNQEYIDSMREKAMRGYRGKAESGLFNAGRPPYGYALVGKKKETTIVFNEPQIEVVRMMSDWCIDNNLSTVQIAAKLKEAGIPTPGSDKKIAHRKRGECDWTPITVYRILVNEAYAGTWYAFRYKKVSKQKSVKRPKSEWIPITIPAAISRERWEQQVARLKARDHERHNPNKSEKSYKTKREYLMSRRLNCACKFHMVGVTRREIQYYRCNSHAAATGFCGARYFRADLVDAVIWAFISYLMKNPRAVLQGYKELQQKMHTVQTVARQQITLVDEQISLYASKLEEIIDMRETAKVQVLRDTLNRRADEYATIINELQAKRAKLREELRDETITDEFIESRIEFVEAMRSELGDVDDTNDVQTKRLLVEALNIRATLRRDEAGEQWVDIHWLDKTYSKPVINKNTNAQQQVKCHNTAAIKC